MYTLSIGFSDIESLMGVKIADLADDKWYCVLDAENTVEYFLYKEGKTGLLFLYNIEMVTSGSKRFYTGVEYLVRKNIALKSFETRGGFSEDINTLRSFFWDLVKSVSDN